MLRLCSTLVNAAVVGSLAVLATKPAPIAKLMAHPFFTETERPVAQAADLAPTPAHIPARTLLPAATLVQGPVRVDAKQPYAGLTPQNLPTLVPAPKAAAPLPFATGSTSPDAVVPPLARRRPAAGPAVAEAPTPNTAPKKRATSDKTAKTAKPTVTPAVADAGKPAKAGTDTVQKTKVAADKKAIDLSGRSALGAAPRGLKCDAGLKYDAKLLKCVAVAPKPAAAPKPVLSPALAVAKR